MYLWHRINELQTYGRNDYKMLNALDFESTNEYTLHIMSYHFHANTNMFEYTELKINTNERLRNKDQYHYIIDKNMCNIACFISKCIS